MKSEEFEKFINNSKKNLTASKSVFKKWESFDQLQIVEDQAFYIVNWKTGELDFSKGFEHLLGVDSNSISFMDVAQNLIHPEDRPKIAIITKEMCRFAFENNIEEGGAFHLSYRLRKFDGSYIKVLRHTGIYEIDQNGRMMSNFAILTNITEFDDDNRINWRISARGHDTENLKRRILKATQTALTTREYEVILLLSKGLTTKAIADKLSVSPETVKSHKKNLSVKFGTTSTVELLIKAREEKIIG